jgi:phosphoribosylanthranilate isomerase
MVKVKICGLTNATDAAVAVAARANYLGFIFYPPSPRAIDQPHFLPCGKRLARIRWPVP